jgi:zinc transporter ZupT
MNAKTIFTAMIPVALGVAAGMVIYTQIDKAITAKG